MKLKSLDYLNFRNYKQLHLDFSLGINVYIGNNGVGKTNLLEGIYYLSCTKSHRVRNDLYLINKDESFFSLDGRLIKNNLDIPLRCIFNESGKNLFLYHNSVSKVSDYIGFFNAVMFYPDDVLLFSSTPKKRRAFVDLELSKLSKVYTHTLNEYYRVLKERNHILKQNRVDDVLMDTLDERLSHIQVKIIRQRKLFINVIVEYANTFYQQFSEEEVLLSYKYQSDIDVSLDYELMIDQFIKKYHRQRDKDYLFKTTSIGIHHDDFIFYLNDYEVNTYASQGQKRLILLSLKLGIVQLIKEKTNEYPVLLLDDVFSELDEIRRVKLLKLLPSDIQIFISTTDFVEIDSTNRRIEYWTIEKGSIVKLRRSS